MTFITDTNFWSKHGLPFFMKYDPEAKSDVEVFETMWVSTLPRGEGIFTLTPKDQYGPTDQMRKICKRIVYEVDTLSKTTFCPVDNTKDHTHLHGLIIDKLLRGYGITDILIIASQGDYKGITIMKEDEDAEGIKFWYISFLCVATGTKGYGSKMIDAIKDEADNTPNIQYVFLESIPESRGFYKKKDFLHVYYGYNDNDNNKSRAICIRDTLLPKITDPPDYIYDEEDLMVYCPERKSQEPTEEPKENTQSNTEKNNGGSKTRRIKKKKKGTRRK